MKSQYLETYTPFFEMSFSKQDFEHKVIIPLMRKILKHVIKYKLTDEDFVSNFNDKGLYTFLKRGNYREYWKDEIVDDLKTLMTNIKESYIDASNKEVIYLESIKDCFIIMSSEKDEIFAIKNAISKYKNRDFVIHQAKRFFMSKGVNSIRTFPWMMAFVTFLKDIKPVKNKIIDEDTLLLKIDKLFSIL
jgi:hypothetical protein